MAILGAHMSIAGGHDRAVHRAAEAGCDCLQFFSKSNNQWRAKAITEKEADRFKAALEEEKITHPIIHDSYLINLASPDDALWKKSTDAFIEELRRAELLGVPYVVTHPGSFTTSNETAGIKRIAQALDEVHRQTPNVEAQCLLETTAGQGTNLGWRFEQIAAILEKVENPDRLGVCFDTCHVFAAGYPMGTEKEYKATFREFDQVIGVKLLRAFHLNDSLRDFGSRKDRHEHIGHGKMGREPFRFILNDRRFKKIPMYLETPKEDEAGRNMDQINLKTLRGLIEK